MAFCKLHEQIWYQIRRRPRVLRQKWPRAEWVKIHLKNPSTLSLVQRDLSVVPWHILIGPNSFPSNPGARLDLIDFDVHMQLLEEVEASGYVQLVCVDTPVFSYVNELYIIPKGT